MTSRWIQTEQGFRAFYSGNKQINLERKYSFNVKILENGKAYYTDAKKEGYRVENLSDQTPVVIMEIFKGERKKS